MTIITFILILIAFIILPIIFIIGMVKPSLLGFVYRNKTKRWRIAWTTTLAAFIMLVAVGIVAPESSKTPKVVVDANVQSASQISTAAKNAEKDRKLLENQTKEVANTVTVTNAKITKFNNQFTYDFETPVKKYDVKVVMLKLGTVVASKALNHAQEWKYTTDQGPKSMGGSVDEIKLYVSIKNVWYPSKNPIAFSSIVDDVDAKNVAIAEAARQAEVVRQNEVARQAEVKRVADAAAVKRSKTQVAKPAPAPSPSTKSYKNCTAVRAAGAAPIYRGQPGYASHLDRDDDGIGCEK